MKYSIITINYNNAIGLEKTIRSVISQTFSDYEFIIIDGGSTDGSTEVIRRYSSKITYWLSEPDNGIYNAMNKGIKNAHGDYLNFMNSGDVFFLSDVLERINKLDLNSDIIIGCHAENGIRNIGKNGITMISLYRWAVDHQASFIKKELMVKHFYDEKFKIASDWKFFIEALVLDNCSFTYIDTIVVDVDMNGLSNTNWDLDRKERDIVLNELLPRRILDDYKILSMINPDLVDISVKLSQSEHLMRFIIWLSNMLLQIKKIIKR